MDLLKRTINRVDWPPHIEAKHISEIIHDKRGHKNLQWRTVTSIKLWEVFSLGLVQYSQTGHRNKQFTQRERAEPIGLYGKILVISMRDNRSHRRHVGGLDCQLLSCTHRSLTCMISPQIFITVSITGPIASAEAPSQWGALWKCRQVMPV